MADANVRKGGQGQVGQGQATGQVSEVDALRAQLAAAQAALLALKTKGQGRISCKVSEKGALSLYGLGRFPVTLYAGQWERLLAPETVAQVREFIAANGDKLARKE